ncbi:MAG TPA: S53 family peptidase [Candidatus Limnocylindrales bacterium]|nr:S53 family peptidase [Candidatus Limnocylindrales bacterium]
MPEERVILRGSLRQPLPYAQTIGTPDPNSSISVSVLLRRRNELPEPGSEIISRKEFAARYGANPADIPALEAFAEDNDLTIVEIDLARRTVVLSGTVADMNEAFGTNLLLFQSPDGIFRGRVGELSIPSHLGEIVTGVFGLDERPQADAHFRRLVQIGPRAAGDTSYTPVAVSKLYSFPATGGTGQTVAIVELGGGYKSADLTAYFTGLGIKPTPSVTAVSVDGAQNQPAGDPNSADGEVLLDIEVVGAIAPAAKIVAYFAPNTDQGFLDAITKAVHDTVHKPSVISISWGGPESAWTAQSFSAFDQAFQDAATLGVTVCCASGDDGSSDGETDGTAHVDFPASSPHALACGGTRLESAKNAISKEVVWNEGADNGATGGGVSETFPLPSYQANSKVPVSVNPTKFKGRGVPDVAGDADPATGYEIRVDGKNLVFGGTSAVAPLWAALIALANQHAGKPLGFLNPALYAAKTGFYDITSGNNGAYSAAKGWDACTGLGSPNGQALVTALSPKSRRET